MKQTIDQTTQWGVALDSFPMKRHLKSRNPALNVPRRHEAVATDTIFSDTPAVDSGVKQAQVFVGRDSLMADGYPKKSGKQFVNTLEDKIRRRAAMDKLLSDSAKTEISKKAMDILRAYHISKWHSGPYHQNQNPAEWRYRTIKSWMVWCTRKLLVSLHDLCVLYLESYSMWCIEWINSTTGFL